MQSLIANSVQFFCAIILFLERRLGTRLCLYSALRFRGQSPRGVPIGMGVPLWICCIFSEHLFRVSALGGCFRDHPIISLFPKILKILHSVTRKATRIFSV